MFFEIVIAVIIGALAYMKWINTYWKRHGVYQLEPDLFFGNIRKTILGKTSLSAGILEHYNEFKAANIKNGGIYHFMNPMYMPIDPGTIKNILLKDFNHFVNRGSFHTKEDLLSMNLFNIEDETWRNLRAKVTPTFTSSKMKLVFETLVDKTKNLEKVFGNYADSAEPCSIKDLLGRFTTDVIASFGFGIECNSLEDSENIFRKVGKKVLEPSLVRYFLMSVVNWKLLGLLNYKRGGIKASNFFIGLIRDAIKQRECHGVYRKDFVQLMLEQKKPGNTNENSKTISEKSNGVPKPAITDDEITAQCCVFFIAGFETSSTVMTFTLLELAQNQDIQIKLREEIEAVLEAHDGKLTYEAVSEMKYLEMIISEALRKYPPVPNLSRICNKRYEVPGTDIVIEKGIRVQIPIFGIQRDPEYYPNPEVFNPENFSEENKAKRPDFTFLPFGDGPRKCIALRFGMLQAKVGVLSLVKNFDFKLNNRTVLPLEVDKTSSIMSLRGDVWMDVKRIS
ncbi:cytochrome P450 6a8-like [Sitophilus oryzae]|uniref:Cytochrome P450 6a8-like n=1 Tax=Sitophilus oryzae TaxID=7048 RepID=A0A6J2X202_SITOR|nr:cytochrome P450 6a8-like [Sitophilus oryzae]